MGLYYRKRLKILPGVNLNLSKSGTSLSVGPRGAKINFSKRGTYLNTGIPGTGIYSREKISSRKRNAIEFENRKLKREQEKEIINKNSLVCKLNCVMFYIIINKANLQYFKSI